MYNVYFDSGTSNTRAYLTKGYAVIDFIKKNIGSKDSSITGSNLVLIKGLKELYDELLGKNGLKDVDIKEIYASGLITSPFGIKEVPHITTPVSLEKLYRKIYLHYEKAYFNRNIHLIRGVKTIAEDFKADKYNIHMVNNMRGEEIEIFGILSGISHELRQSNIAIFLPGSHTHIAFIQKGVLCDMVSNFSGELYHAVSTATILSGSLKGDNDKLDEEMVLRGFNHLKEYGLNRALYIAHATKIFDACRTAERKSYIEGVINGGVVLAFDYALKNNWPELDKVLIAGGGIVGRVYQTILNQLDKDIEAVMISPPGSQSFAVKGFMEILKIHGNLK